MLYAAAAAAAALVVAVPCVPVARFVARGPFRLLERGRRMRFTGLLIIHYRVFVVVVFVVVVGQKRK